MADRPPRPHSRAKYIREGCRCEICVQAHADYQREIRAFHASRPVPRGAKHGTIHCYIYYHCRCMLCRAENAAVKQRQRAQARKTP